MLDINRIQMSFAKKSTSNANYKFEDLMSLISHPIWVKKSLNKILTNTGKRTAGIDGITLSNYLNKNGQKSQRKIGDTVMSISDELKSRRYKPLPVRRVYIPKPGSKKMRPLGIPTIKDRTVQQALKMLLEPIWESDFLDCNYGFRRNRNTWHAIIGMQPMVINKYHWAIEGDISKYFDTVNHKILLEQVERRIKDRHVIKVINDQLKSGIMDEGLFADTTLGTHQGGVVSPLLSNIYLHMFDEWWYRRWGQLTKGQRAYRRKKGEGHFRLYRYADDWVMLSNANKKHVKQEREEIHQFLKAIKLSLNMDKTHLTHLRDGFDFLGFRLQMFNSRQTGKQFFRITAKPDGIKRYKRKLKQLTKRNTVNEDYRQKIIALNRVIRGWANYYRYAHMSKIYSALDWYAKERIAIWLKAKTGKGINYCLWKYQVTTEDGKQEWGSDPIPNTGEKQICLFKMVSLGIISDPRKMNRDVRVAPKGNPYLLEEDLSEENPNPIKVDDYFITEIEGKEILQENTWTGSGQPKGHPLGWEMKTRRTKIYDTKCVECGAFTELATHYRREKSEKGRLNRTLCRKCHNELHEQLKKKSHPLSFSLSMVKTSGEPYDGKLSRTVRKEGQFRRTDSPLPYHLFDASR